MAVLLTRVVMKKRYQYMLLLTIVIYLVYYIIQLLTPIPVEIDFARQVIEQQLEEALKEDKGTGCDIPKTDPFDPEIMKFNKKLPPIVCHGVDWVKCYLSTCKPVPEAMVFVKNMQCEYRDILYNSDNSYTLGPIKVFAGDYEYKLDKSDHVDIRCKGDKNKETVFGTTWRGHGAAFRPLTPKKPPPGRETTYNVLIFGFDSTSKNHFIRKMPKSYKFLQEELNPVILNGYNIVGDGTPAALFPILTGKTELELPECRKSIKGSGHLDSMPFIFYKLKEDGYRTAYFEDSPWIGTFQYRFNGFLHQPADHYLRDFYLEVNKYNYIEQVRGTTFCVGGSPRYKLMMSLTEQLSSRMSRYYRSIDVSTPSGTMCLGDKYRTAYFEDMPWIGTFQYRFNGFLHQPADHYLRDFYLEVGKYNEREKVPGSTFCVGGTPRYKLMMSLTDQFFQLDGKKFGFTFVADITHDDPNHLGNADDDLVEFLRGLLSRGVFKNTLFMLMGDHGARYAAVRETLQGKLEERLPLMAIRLPDDLVAQRPDALVGLTLNADVVTTPHDIYATIVDVLDMRQHYNPYKIKGADYTRGLTLLKEISKNRTCSEAGIERHWCACLKWEPLATTDPMYYRTAEALVDHINSIIKKFRHLCARRDLTSIPWVMRKKPNDKLMAFSKNRDGDGYLGSFNSKAPYTEKTVYQVKIEVGPGKGVYEAAVTHHHRTDQLFINSREISRTNRYNDEPACISADHPNLNPYCYCII